MKPDRLQRPVKRLKGRYLPSLVAAAAMGLLLLAGSGRADDLIVDGGATYTVLNDLTFTNGYVGNLSAGTVNQSGFTNALSGLLYLAYAPGSSGLYNLSGGTVSTYGTLVGNGGTGTFIQTGGTNINNGGLALGNLSGSSGLYYQSGGVHLLASTLMMAFNQGSSGVYNLSSGSLSSGNFEFVGYRGSGVFNQSGGTHKTIYSLYQGYYAGSSGIYNLSNGSLSTARQFVGYFGTGIFNQTGGSNTVLKLNEYSDFNLGYWQGSNGIYNLINGSLTTPSELIGVYGLGAFNQSGGTNTIKDGLILGFGRTSSGAYNLSKGSLTVGSEGIGYNGSGTFNQIGGTHTIAGDLEFGSNASGSGTYILSGGSLLVNGEGSVENIGHYGSGFFIQTGGSNDATNLIVGNSTGTGTYALLGGSLYVTSSYLQGSHGTLEVGITSPTTYGRIPVTAATGTAALAGTLKPVPLAGFFPGNNQFFPQVITAAGGVSGAFDNVTSGRLLLWQPLYSANSVGLMVMHNPALGLNSNEQQVFNSVGGGARGDLGSVFNAIDSLDSAVAVKNAFKQISPEKAGSFSTLAFAGAASQNRALAQRLTSLRYADLGTTAGPGAGVFGFGGSRLEGLRLAYNGASLSELITGQKEVGPEGRFGVFLQPNLILGSQTDTANQTGFNFTTESFTLGADYRLRDDLLVGLASGYSHSGAAFRGSGGAVQNNSWPLLAYTAYLAQPCYAFASLGYCLNLFNLDRDLSFGSGAGSINRKATSSTSGHQLNFYGESGYDLKWPRLVVTPLVSLAYSKLWANGFSEDGAGDLNLKVGSQSAESLQTAAGGKVALPLKRNSTLVLPEFYATYQHGFSDNSRGLDARFGGGSTFTWQTSQPRRDFAVVGASVTIFKKGFSGQLTYNAEVGRGNYLAHLVNAGLRWQF